MQGFGKVLSRVVCTRGVSMVAVAAGLAAFPGAALAQTDESVLADPSAETQAVEQQVQDTPVSAEAPVQEQEAIVVTGSRVARSGFTTPTPVTVVGDEQIQRQGASNIAQVLNEIPAFRAQSSPATTAIFVSNLGASTADLRGLGGNRTLVLIDGRRVVASAVAGGGFTPANTVDLNLVPSSLLQRVEVVTGGASAAYGSDAVAGVTNLIINRDLRGVRSTVQYGMSEEGDNDELLVSLAYGTDFGSDRWRFIVGAEYVNNQGAGDCYTRDWCAESWNTVNNPFVPGSTTERVIAGQPAIIIMPNARTATASLNGLIVGGPLRGTEFNPNGTTFQHDYGVYGSGLFQSGGGDPILPFYQFFPLSAPSERINIFSNLDYDLTDDINVFAQVSYGHVNGTILGASRRDVAPPGSYQIRRDNAFLPDSVREQMVNLNLATLPFGRIWNDLGPQVGDVTRDTFRAVSGFSWDFGGNWNLDGYYQYGQTDYRQRGYNTTVNSRMAFAIDAVRDPGTGQIVCRATLPGPGFNPAAAGCVPLNPFGEGASSSAARDYVTETAQQDTTLKQHVVALTLRGDIVDLWAGPLSFAGGLEYRKDSVSSVTDAISARNDFHTSPGGGIAGGEADLDVKEGFVELALPLARDLPFARSAELNGAIRVTDYSNSGRVETWKIGADWQPVEFIRFRGTRSRDIRAPNLFELYGAPQSSFQTVDDGAAGRLLVPTLLSGNTALQPEVADTWTAGAVVTANLGGAGNFRASVDWFDISLDGAISTLGAQIIRDRCVGGDQALCEFVIRNEAGQLTQIINPQLNLNTLITRGWDVEADYTLPLTSLGIESDDRLNLRVLATFVKDLITVDTSGIAVDRAGQNGSGVSQPSGVPDYTINGFITYQGDPFAAQLQIRHISSGVYNVLNIGPHQDGYDPSLPNSISDNKVGAVTYVNLNAQYTVWERGEQSVEVFGVVNNLFNQDPPKDLPSSFGPTNNVLYDVVGRSYRLGVRFAL
ncbi:TonB-dependent siderophore receptor [Sphingosinicella sp. CPCC 101087]|uniref:TonB-dependent receptor plug domain-containing protein n=1 Tax=Sphingosinicella sp. CPCC 101087 TaxID=2497754 RepID=UPI00101C0F60|nr:TonB-dependent receptor [Sphingosinicella sp. CPCC 101087]